MVAEGSKIFMVYNVMGVGRPEFFSSKFKRLSVDQSLAIERPFSDEEIKMAVWECGDDKAPGDRPDAKSAPAIVEPLRIEKPLLEGQFQEDPPKDPPEVPMTDNRTMAEMLRAPIEGYAEAIIVPPILAEQFEIKHSLINMMTSKYFLDSKRTIRMITFIGAAHQWLEKEPSRSITTWEDLVSKFINEFFPPLWTTSLRNEISNFEQKFDESIHEAWDRYKDLLRACPHHDFTELHQLNTFYNALNYTDQDSLNVATCGNLLERSTQNVLTIIENKSKVRNSQSKSIAFQVKACDTNSSSEIAKLTHAVNEKTSAMTTAMTAMLRQFQATPPPAPVKVVEETYVTCEGAHPYYQCLAAGGNTFPELRDNIQGYFLAAAVQYNQGNPGYRPLGMANQTRPPGSGSLPSNIVANPKGELKAITTRSGLVIDGPTIPIPPTSINPEVNERVEETFTDLDLAEYTIKAPPPPGKDSSLKDSSIQTDRDNLDDYFVDPIPEMFTEEHAPDYSSPPKFDDFSRVDDLPSPDDEDKVFNPGILIHEKLVTIITHVAQEKKLAISYASLVFMDFEPLFCAPLFFKDIPMSRMMLPFSTKNNEKVFKPGIHTSGKDYPDCEVFRALSFLFIRASHPQLHFRNPVSKSYRVTFSFGIPNKRP
nr:hypothetical protein [Tanacetum cinerariifolium]